MLATAQWNLTKALEISTPLASDKLFWINLQYIGSSLVPVIFLALALAYHSQRKWLTRPYLPLFIIPAATLFFAWTNIGGLFWRQTILDQSSFIPTRYHTGLLVWHPSSLLPPSAAHCPISLGPGLAAFAPPAR
jgi:hypothetical protein